MCITHNDGKNLEVPIKNYFTENIDFFENTPNGSSRLATLAYYANFTR